MNSLPFSILRELIVRFTDYKLIIKIKILNKRFYNFITNDNICQKRYLKLKYNLEPDKNMDLKEFINILDSKFLSAFN